MKKIVTLALFALLGTTDVSAALSAKVLGMMGTIGYLGTKFGPYANANKNANAIQKIEYAKKSGLGKVAHAATSKKAIVCYLAVATYVGYQFGYLPYVAGQAYDNTLFPVRMLKALLYGGRGGYVDYNS